MKKMIILLILMSQAAMAENNKIEGTFSARKKDMVCQGHWDHPFLPINRGYGGRIPSTPLLMAEDSTISISQQHSGVKITKIDGNGKTESVESIQGFFRGMKIKNLEDSIIIKQYDSLEVIFDYGTYIGIVKNMRFKAKLSFNSNNDLILENFYAKDKEVLQKRIVCVLKRI